MLEFKMNRKEYFESPEGQRHLHRERRRRRLIFIWDLEPKAHKKIQKTDKESFINHLVDVMTKQRRKFYRSDLALKIDIEVSSKTPPAIEKIPKGYIDLLHRRYHNTTPSSLSRSKQVRLLMEDDSQIKYLNVSFYVSEKKSSFTLKACKLDHLVLDLALLRDLDTDFQNEDHDCFQEYDNERFLEKHNKFFDDTTVTILQYMDERNRQESLLDIIGFNFHMFETLMYGYERHNDCLSHFKNKLYQIRRDQIFNFPSCVTLGPPPLATGDSNNFKKLIKDSLNQKMLKFGLTKPILHPIRCTIVVIQPDETIHVGKRKDIDNYAFDFILPIVHEELAPYTTIGKIFNSTYPFANEHSYFPSQNGLPNSVLQYTVIEIPRLSTDPEEGSVFMFLGIATLQGCYWNELDFKIDHILKR